LGEPSSSLGQFSCPVSDPPSPSRFPIAFAFLGWRFSVVRTLITLPVFIAVGVVMEKLLADDFVLPETDRGATGDAVRRCT